MEESILIPSSHIKYLVPGYKQRLEEIDFTINQLEQERKEIKKIIADVEEKHIGSVSHTINDSGISSSGYDNTSSLFSRIKFILRKEGKPLTTAQIVDGILFHEPALDRTLVIRNVSSILGLKSKANKEVERFTSSGKNQKFGLK